MIKFLITLLLVSGCGKKITEEETKFKNQNALLSGVSEEILLDTSMSLNFDYLPLKGEVKREGRLWSGDAWQLNRGAINYRWNAPDKEGFTYLSPGPRQIMTYPREKMKELSPAEKMDLYNGDYDYPLRWEVDTLARQGRFSWEGICHGWAGASMNHPEPGPVTVRNPDGVEIYFGSADIKALLSYAYSKVLIDDNESLGKRCEDLDGDLNCDDDLTALTFHAVISNIMGLRGKSLIADVDRFKEVWNHPLVSYESTILSMKGTRTGREAIISTKLKYADVVQKNLWEKGNADLMSYMTVKYKIVMDEKGNMLSSEWLSYERPDFLWTVKKQNAFIGRLSKLIHLLK